MSYGAVLFDVGDTLIEYAPSYAESYLRRMQSLTAEPLPHRLAAEIDLAIKQAEYNQLTKEYNGEPRMPDEE